MRKFIWLLSLGALASCILFPQTTSNPEGFLFHTKNLTVEDLKVIHAQGFDFFQQTPTGISYLEKILTTPSYSTETLFKFLLSENIVDPKGLFPQNRTLLSAVLRNTSLPVALAMADMLLSSSHADFYLRSHRSPLWDALENTNPKIRWQLVSYLQSKGLSLITKDPKTGNIPAFTFLKLYDGNDDALLQEVLKTISPRLKDKEGRNVWHYLFQNPSLYLEKVTEQWIKNPLYTRLLAQVDKNSDYPLFLLAANSKAPRTYPTILKVAPFYESLFRNREFTGRFLLHALKNEGEALRPLFLYAIAHNPDMNVLDKKHRNSFLMALKNPRPEIIPILAYLLSSHVNGSQQDSEGMGYMGYTLLLNQGAHVRTILNFLERQGFSFTRQDKKGYAALSYAVRNEGPYAAQTLNYLISRNFPVLIPDGNQKIAMEYLFDNPNPLVLKMLRKLIYSKYQGKPNEVYSRNIVFVAAGSKNPRVHKLLLTLLQQGFNPYDINEKHQNVLFTAVQNQGEQTVSVVRLLLTKGLPTDMVDADGNNIFVYAVRNPMYRYVLTSLLLTWNVDINKKNNNGASALDFINSLTSKEKERFNFIFRIHDLELRDGQMVHIKKRI